MFNAAEITDMPRGGHMALNLTTGLSKRVISEQSTETESDDLEKDLAQEQKYRKTKQKFHGWTLMWLAYQSLGVVYGDIGTSPLYVYSSTFTSTPSQVDIIGALSIIIWSLTLIVSVKYVCIVLHADDDGEGGTFALYSLLARFSNIGREDPLQKKTIKLERYATDDLRQPNRGFRSMIENSAAAKVIFKIAGVLGVSLIMADGVLTPAQSVLGAIQGLKVIKSDLSSSVIIGVTCAILILLFLVQPFGIGKITILFSPVIIVWLLFNLVIGIYNLVLYDHSVLKAFSPYFAGHYLVINGTEGWRSLGGLLLAFTGVEAMFADLGAFGARAIQISWLAFAYPCLLFAYIGQAAYISADKTGQAWTNPFFNSVPSPAFYPALVISVLAAVVASQAIITGSFQLLIQIMNLSYFPRLKVKHTSKKFHGQVYISIPNWLLMIGTVVVTAAYNNTTRLGNAYGVCVIFVTFLTTCMVSVVAIVVWKINAILVVFFFLVFGSLDGVYVSAVIIKVPSGAWLTLAIAFVLSTICYVWHACKEYQWKLENFRTVEPNRVLRLGTDGKLYLRKDGGQGDQLVAPIGGVGVFYDRDVSLFPPLVSEFITKFRARHNVIVLLSIRPMGIPTLPEEARFSVLRTWMPNCYRLIVRCGYAEDIAQEEWDGLIFEHISGFLRMGEGSVRRSSEEAELMESTTEYVRNAFNDQITYIKPKKRYLVDTSYNFAIRCLLRTFAWVDVTTSGTEDLLRVPPERVIELGYRDVI